MMPIEIRTTSFDPWNEIKLHQQKMDKEGQYGATASFVGTMRDFNDGETVQSMTLEHYPGMTEKHLEKICTDAHQKWDLIGDRNCRSHRPGLCLVCTSCRGL